MALNERGDLSKIFLLCGWWGTGTACLKRLWKPHPWKCSQTPRWGFEQPDWVGSAPVTVVRTRWPLKGAFQPKLLYDFKIFPPSPSPHSHHPKPHSPCSLTIAILPSTAYYKVTEILPCIWWSVPTEHDFILFLKNRLFCTYKQHQCLDLCLSDRSISVLGTSH